MVKVTKTFLQCRMADCLHVTFYKSCSQTAVSPDHIIAAFQTYS